MESTGRVESATSVGQCSDPVNEVSDAIVDDSTIVAIFFGKWRTVNAGARVPILRLDKVGESWHGDQRITRCRLVLATFCRCMARGSVSRRPSPPWTPPFGPRRAARLLLIMASADRYPCSERLPPAKPVSKPATVRRLARVDPSALAAVVGRLSDEAWRLEDSAKENDYACFHHTRHVVFRFIAGNRDPRDFYSNPGWHVWRRWLEPLMDRAASAYRFRRPVFPKAMLARLEAGRRIDVHTDGAWSNPLVHKIHIPLQTNPRAMLVVDGVRVHLAAGYAWEVNNLVPHGVFNGGARDRIHLIFEVFEGAGSNASATD